MLNKGKVAAESMDNPNGSFYGSIEAAKLAGISLRQLYHWVDHLHVVTPAIRRYGLRLFRRFSHEDLETLRKVRLFLERGFTLRAAAEMAKGERNSAETP